MIRTFRELRLHSHKPPQEFLCELLHQEEKYAVLRYCSAESYAFGPVVIEKGGVTIAHYWEERNYLLWLFKKPDTSLTGYLFHVVRDVEIGADSVSYMDLELDIWFTPGGSPTVLDEDEVLDYYDKGIFDDQTVSLIEEQKKAILKNFSTIIKDVWSNEEHH
jgi:predicted RNA-binding protein associated with RNAse of E/G family